MEGRQIITKGRKKEMGFRINRQLTVTLAQAGKGEVMGSPVRVGLISPPKLARSKTVR